MKTMPALKNTNTPLITVFPPSSKMMKSFHLVAALAEKEGNRDAELKSGKSTHHLIDAHYVRSGVDIADDSYARGNIGLLSVINAKKHCDDEFAWSALWCLRSAGHILHVQDKIRKPTFKSSVALIPGSLYLFDSRLPHWTTNGVATLVVASEEHDERPSVKEVYRKFDTAIKGAVRDVDLAAPSAHVLTEAL